MMAQVNAGRVRFVGRGEYNNSTQYYVFDLVNYNGNSYYAKVDTIGNLPTNTTYWQLVAEKGNVGPTGLTGNGISSIEKTSTSGLVDTYTITYTNGNTTTFDVSNGNGIDRIEKTATVGNKDTYTIYFTNGSTTTYEVSNGEVTREELEEEVERLSMIYNAFPSTTGEVEEGSINGTAEVPFKEIGLKGNTSQESTTGKNLLPNNATTQTIRGITFTINEDKSITLNGTNDNTGSSTLFLITEADNFSLNAGTYNSIATGVSGVNIGAYDGTNYYTFAGGSGNSITLQNNTSFASVYLQVSKGSSTTFNNKKIYPILSLTPVSESDYEPYTNGPAPNPDYPYPVNVVTGDNEVIVSNGDNTQSQTYPINLGSMELCKIGDYQDYLYKENGIWYKYGAIGKVVLDGSETWYRWSANTFYITKLTEIRNALSNYYTYNSTATGGGQLSNGEFFIHDSTNNNVVIFKNTGINDSIEAFKAWLSTHNVILYYALLTPTTTEITDTTLIEQLDNLENAYSYDTQTNISQTNQDKPFIISYEAILSLRNVFNQGN